MAIAKNIKLTLGLVLSTATIKTVLAISIDTARLMWITLRSEFRKDLE